MSSWRQFLFPWLQDRQIIAENQFSATDLGFNGAGSVVAVGYFVKGERSLDVFVLDENKMSVSVYSWNSEHDRYVKTEAVAEAENQMEIVSVIAGDFNHDGLLDLLVTQRDGINEDLLHHRLFINDGTSLRISGFRIASSRDDFLAADLNGRMLIDLLGVDASSGALQAWMAKTDDPRGLVTNFADPSRLAFTDCRPVKPQSHAFADFNGDGFADLLLTCQGGSGVNYLQLLTSTETGFVKVQEIDLPRGHGPISVADFSASGSLDVAFAVCDPPEDCSQRNEIHVLFNQQRPFCSRPGQANCKSLNQIMESDNTFGFTPKSNSVVVDLNKVFGSTRYRVKTASSQGAPVHLGVGDFDVNGFPDLLVVVEDTQDRTSRVMLLENIPLNGNLRTFAHMTKGTAALQQISGVTSAAFVNFYQDGPPDVIVNYQNAKNVPSTQVIQNGFVQDAFFLRVETLNGVCPGPCMALPQSTAARPYGASFPGPTVKFSFTDFDGSLRIRLGAQLPQSGHNRIDSPFSFFGLGRTNNFVELLSVRTPARFQPNLASKAGLVPNSDLIINPPHADSPHNFHFELHILPAKYFLWVLMSIGTAMLVLGALTAFFKWKELKEDNEERRKAIHSINFDAL